MSKDEVRKTYKGQLLCMVKPWSATTPAAATATTARIDLTENIVIFERMAECVEDPEENPIRGSLYTFYEVFSPT